MSKIINMEKQKVWVQVNPKELSKENKNLIVHRVDRKAVYTLRAGLTDFQDNLLPIFLKTEELYTFSPGELVEKLKEAWNAGYNRCVFEVSPHNGIFGIPPIEESYIAQQNIKDEQ